MEGNIELVDLLYKLQTGISRIEFESMKKEKIGFFNASAYIEALISANILAKNEETYFLCSGTDLMVDIMNIENKKSNSISYEPDQFFVEEIQDLLEY